MRLAGLGRCRLLPSFEWLSILAVSEDAGSDIIKEANYEKPKNIIMTKRNYSQLNYD
jgi:hypothetical protein